MVGDVSTDSFYLVLLFTSGTGYSKSIRDDDGTCFVSAQQELSKALQMLGISRIKGDWNQGYIMRKFNLPSMDGWCYGGSGQKIKKVNY